MNHTRSNKKLAFIFLTIILGTFIFSGCIRRKDAPDSNQIEAVSLSFYGLFDSEEVYKPIIEDFQSQNPHVSINYKRFNDPVDYLDTIINELAEGEGPDIFMLSNTQIPEHFKKITPSPEGLLTKESFESSFVEVTHSDLIFPDESGANQIWGLPLYVDTLALYYNDDHIEEALPTQGRPSDTWEGIAQDVQLLNKEDQSFERFERAGIALGRSDNISRSFDVLMAMFLQYKIDFYNEDLTQVIFQNDQNSRIALELFASFGLPSQSNYSWNKFLADEESSEKEITTFASGKVSMILGYSYLYEDLVNEIARLKQNGEDTIELTDIKIQEIPQVYDPDTSTETRETYASYFVPVVGRTSDHPEQAWDFLLNLVSLPNQQHYNDVTHRTSANRALISEQQQDPIYGIFATQVGYANSVIMPDAEVFSAAFIEAMDRIIQTERSDVILNDIAQSIQNKIPSTGIKPSYVPSE
jgi:ABC-type glycerol-3-phosphate transport system substrate-binding protein